MEPKSTPIIEYCPFCKSEVARIWTKRCKGCRQEFSTPKRSQQYCSQECITIGRRLRRGAHVRYDRLCEHCGEAYVARRSNTKYCSTKCNNGAYCIRKALKEIRSTA